MSRSMLLNPPGIGVADWPAPFPHALDHGIARAVADGCHEHDDRVLWALLLGDETRLGALDAASRSAGCGPFQTVAKPSGQPTLWEAA